MFINALIWHVNLVCLANSLCFPHPCILNSSFYTLFHFALIRLPLPVKIKYPLNHWGQTICCACYSCHDNKSKDAFAILRKLLLMYLIIGKYNMKATQMQFYPTPSNLHIRACCHERLYVHPFQKTSLFFFCWFLNGTKVKLYYSDSKPGVVHYTPGDIGAVAVYKRIN